MDGLNIGHLLKGGAYSIVSVKGQGGFGIVYLATNTANNEYVAIKEFFPQQFARREQGASVSPQYGEKKETAFYQSMTHFEHEAELLSEMDHPNIIPVFDYFKENNTVYMVMPVIGDIDESETLSLESFLETGTLDQTQANALLVPLVDAIEYIHSKGLIHRDIKPENILISSDDRPILIDFGSSKFVTTDKKLTALVSAGYSPPEQYDADGVGLQGNFSDIYSLCATFYHAITGTQPIAATMRFIKDNVHTLDGNKNFSEFDNRLLKLIDLGLELNYELRPATMQDLLHKSGFKYFVVPQEPATGGGPQEPDPPPPPPPPPEEANRFVPIMMLVFVLGILVVGLDYFKLVNIGLFNKEPVELTKVTLAITPQNAVVKLNGEITSLRTLNLSRQMHTLSVSARDYQEIEKNYRVGISEQTWTIDLVAKSYPVYVDINPTAGAAAKVSLSGVESFTNGKLLPFGSYDVTISKPGFDVLTSRITVSGDSRTDNRFAFDLSQILVDARIRVTPRNARQNASFEFVDEPGVDTTAQPFKVPQKSMTVKVSAPGYETTSVTLDATSGEPDVTVRLKEIEEQPAETEVVVTAPVPEPAEPDESRPVVVETETRPKSYIETVLENMVEVKPAGSAAFNISMYEVSVADWQQCVAAGRCQALGASQQNPVLPVINVKYNDAITFINWLNSLQSGLNFRLPTKKQWEQAFTQSISANSDKNNVCRIANIADSSSLFPWKENCNDGFPALAPVTALRRGDRQIVNLLGNVWELTSSCLQDKCEKYIVKGGAYNSFFERLQIDGTVEKESPQDNVGFRLIL